MHRAMKGPRFIGSSRSSQEGWQAEIVATLKAIQQVRQTCDNTELVTVKYARRAGLTWAEIATSLGVTRQAAWERWHELDDTLHEGSPKTQ